MMKNKCGSFFSKLLIARLAVFFAIVAVCAESQAEQVKILPSGLEVLPNQGFVKGAKKENLKTRFPICDEFLDVTWLNREQGVGYVKHDLYKGQKPAGHMESLVVMHTQNNNYFRPWDRLELYDFRREGVIAELFQAIGKDSSFSKLGHGEIVVGNTGRTFLLQRNNSQPRHTYGDNRQNVCISYADGGRMWLAERKLATKVLSARELTHYVKRIKKILPFFSWDHPIGYRVEDLNGDGNLDFFTNNFFVLSEGEHFFSVERKGAFFDKGIQYFSFYRKDTSITCSPIYVGVFFVTTDDKNGYLNNQCSFAEF